MLESKRVYVKVCMCGGQRTGFRSWFSSSVGSGDHTCIMKLVHQVQVLAEVTSLAFIRCFLKIYLIYMYINIE